MVEKTPCLALETGLVGPLTPHYHCDSLTWVPDKRSVYISTTLRTMALFATGVTNVGQVETIWLFAATNHLNRN